MRVKSLGFRTDLEILELTGSEIEYRADRLVVRTPANPSFFWGNFYLLAAPPAKESVSALLAEYDLDFPDSEHRAIAIDGIEDFESALEPLIGHGLEPDLGIVLTASVLADLGRRPDAELRPLHSDADWAQRVRVSEAINVDHEPGAYREFALRKVAADRARCEAGAGIWWGAFVDGQLASHLGIVDLTAGLGRYQQVETHPDFRGRGLASALLRRAGVDALTRRGASTLVIVADPDYHAIEIYRRAGFVDAEVQTQLQQFSRR